MTTIERDPRSLRIALVHEWLQDRAGSERTFLRMAEALPSADLFALTVNPAVDFGLGRRALRTTALQATRLTRERRSFTLPLMPLAWKVMRVPDAYDLLVTSSHAFSRYIPAKAGAHLSYIYSPMRYAWSPEIDGRAGRPMLAFARRAMRSLDLRSARRVDSFAASSTAVAERIRRFYGCDARVIFPPVDVDERRPRESSEPQAEFLLGLSRWIPYKRLDLLVEVGEAVKLPVVIAGRGPQANQLRRLAASSRTPVTVEESPSDERVAHLLRTCAALVFPAHEDFGIVPVEAQACGTKVVALGSGGALDTVVDGVTGILSPTQDVADLADATRQCLALGDRRQDCVDNARRFSVDAFKRSFVAWISEAA